ncbi:caspase-1-like isoform X2 [Monodelphis domestica]|uniref:caspase-1-like isoform X2 n=1 Tax=Monodelphis domestica TaxID=13616 RepID=UPI00044361D8|nr:caspase-1-like isoform X2 [Monodelphis domestica]
MSDEVSFPGCPPKLPSSPSGSSPAGQPDYVEILKGRRKNFVESVDKSVINDLLDDMMEAKVLNQEEIEEILDQSPTIMRRARVLIDYVIRRGSKACKLFIECIWRRDKHLAEKMKLPPQK